MQFLTHELAQEIVDRTMKIINTNINVMNEKGIIIGSGDSGRIHQLHDGAVLVLKNGESLEIDEDRAGRMKGSKPGINLPIRFNKQIVGVVGITGEPRQIQHYAQLVKMAAELVLEQSFLLERVQWKQRIQSEIVNQLISEEGLNEDWIKERAGILGLDLAKPRMAIVLKPVDPDANQELIKSVQYQLGKNDLAGVTLGNEIVILKEKAGTVPPDELTAFLKRLLAAAEGGMLIGSGGMAPGLKELKYSFQQAQRAILAGSRILPDASIYRYEDLRIETMLVKLAKDEYDQPAFSFYQKLLGQGNKELVHTLDVYIKEGGDLSRVAESLFIHRNTLRYRLDKIAEMTSKDPRNVKDLMELYTARLVHELR
ncbi:CdaR family transcriptional regulator [Peribacillus sp. SCS-37]|uniref:CdaR family transcriptional regulator n=1 Tax=Paraperibacillus esterisolvens TaxID=3115296 RepID=UPI00390668CA